MVTVDRQATETATATARAMAHRNNLRMPLSRRFSCHQSNITTVRKTIPMDNTPPHLMSLSNTIQSNPTPPPHNQCRRAPAPASLPSLGIPTATRNRHGEPTSKRCSVARSEDHGSLVGHESKQTESPGIFIDNRQLGISIPI